MKELAIICHESIGPIKLGESRLAVREILEKFGAPLSHTRNALDYFCNNSISVEFDEDETASFIGLSSNAPYICTYKAVNVFNIPAEELFSLMAANETVPSAHKYDDSGYVFPNQILTLYDADSQYDKFCGETRPIWGQVGIGDARYWAAVEKYQ